MKDQLKSRDWVDNLVVSVRPIEQSDVQGVWGGKVCRDVENLGMVSRRVGNILAGIGFSTHDSQ